MGRIWLLALFLVGVCTARAEPNLPEIKLSADAYRQEIQTLRVNVAVDHLLREIRRAESVRNRADFIRFQEQFVTLNTDNFQAWLKLSLAWREADRRAEKGLAAAFVAHSKATSPSQQIEALLLMSSFLRARLQHQRVAYEENRDAARKAEARLLEILEPKGDLSTSERDRLERQRADYEANRGSQNSEIRLSELLRYSRNRDLLDLHDPTGNIRLLNQTRDNAVLNAESALQEITNTASALDEIYKEIAKVPGLGLDPEKMKSGDDRGTAFSPVIKAGGSEHAIDFRIHGEQVIACVAFTHDLKPGDTSYRNFVDVDATDSKLAIVGVEAKARSLCLSGLKPGETHRITLKAGLPSKHGAKLERAVVIDKVGAPDLPETIAFSGRQFILPLTGPGEVPISAINAEYFELELLRITDRTLHRQIALGHIGEQLPYKEYQELREHFAERIWDGTVKLGSLVEYKNQVVRSSIPVRALLDQRRTWIQSGLPDRQADRAEVSSPSLSFPVASDNQRITPQLAGRFYAGAADFERATLDRPNPGVYALMTRDLAGGLATRLPSCTQDCSDFVVQWFVNTDLGLTFYEGDSKFFVVARSLQSGGPKINAKIELVAANNRVLASGVTDDFGAVSFDRTLTRGTQSNALVAILAHHEMDFGFLTFSAERLDLSRLNIDGRPLSQGLNAFVTTDRGIYQQGDTVEVVALLRDAQGRAPSVIPAATIRLQARDRTIESPTIRPQEWLLGGTRARLTIPNNLRPGIARIGLSLDGGSTVIGQTVIQVGPIQPDRARLEFLNEGQGWAVQKTSRSSIKIVGKVRGQFLFAEAGTRGGAAANLKAEVLVRIAAAETPITNCYRDFTFGTVDAVLSPVSARQFIEHTDSNGVLNLNLSDIPIPNSLAPLAATVEVTLLDSGGPVGSRSQSFAISDDKNWIGVRKALRLQPGSISGTTNLSADIIRVSGDNRAIPAGPIEYFLEREQDQYVWEKQHNTWQHKRSVRREPIIRRVVQSRDLRPVVVAPTEGADCVQALRLPDVAQSLETGRYVLTVRDTQSGKASSIRFYTGAVLTEVEQLEPSLFTLVLDKKTYNQDDTVQLSGDVPFDGEVLIAFADEDILKWASGQARNGRFSISFQLPLRDGGRQTPKEGEWAGKNIHALATVFRTGAGGTTRAGPARILGAAYFEVSGRDASYSATIELVGDASQGSVASNDPFSFRVCIAQSSAECSGTTPERAADRYPEAYAAAFIVDEGLLTLTGHHYPPPDPKQYFHGKTRLGLRMMDNYGRLLLKPGGDRPTRLVLSNYFSSRVVSLAFGPHPLQNGRVEFKVPGLDLQNTTATIFVIVWSKDYAIATKKNLTVRTRVVADLSAPSFLYSGDRAVLPLRLQNIDFAHQGEYAVRVKASGAVRRLSLVGAAPSGAPTSEIEFRQSLKLDEAPKTSYLALETAPGVQGSASIEVELRPLGPPAQLRGFPKSWAFQVRQPLLSSVETATFPISGQARNLSRLAEEMVRGNYDPGSVRVRVHVADSPQGLLLGPILGARQQSGGPVLEHLIANGLSLLHSDSAVRADIQTDLQRIIREVLGLQLPEGSFVPYRTQGDPSISERNLVVEEGILRRSGLLRTTAVLDFLWLARQAGYSVPDSALRGARQFIEKHDDFVLQEGNCPFDALYATRVLVDMGRHDPTRMAEIERCTYEGLPEKAAGASVLTKFGRTDRAQLIFATLQKPIDATELENRDELRLAMMLSFLLEAGAPTSLVDEVAKVILAQKDGKTLSATVTAWLVRATSVRGSSAPPSKWEVSDVRVQGTPLQFRTSRSGALESEPIEYRNLNAQTTIRSSGNKEGHGLLTIEGTLTKAGHARRLPDGALKRRYFDYESGRELNLITDQVNIGDRLVVMVEGTEQGLSTILDNADKRDAQSNPALLVADLLPSAFKIVSSTFQQQVAHSDSPLSRLEPRGDLRSVEASPDRWVAVVIPESELRADQLEQSNPSAIEQKVRLAKTDGVEYRQFYVARVGMAGQFALPAASLEVLGPSATTLRTEQSTIQIRIPEIAPR